MTQENNEPGNPFAAASFKPGIYRHYKGKLYYALGLSVNPDTKVVNVVYRPLYDVPEWSGWFHRNMNEWNECIKGTNILSDTPPTYRFERLDASVDLLYSTFKRKED